MKPTMKLTCSNHWFIARFEHLGAQFTMGCKAGFSKMPIQTMLCLLEDLKAAKTIIISEPSIPLKEENRFIFIVPNWEQDAIRDNYDKLVPCLETCQEIQIRYYK